VTRGFTGEPVVGPIRGYRWWRVTPDGWLESPWYSHTRWLPDRNLAECRSPGRRLMRRGWRKRHPSGVPGRGCGCGFYGLHRVPEPDDCSGKLWEMDPTTWSGAKGFIFGVIAAWGRVLVGTEGWRAERGHPVALYVPNGSRIATDGRLPLVLSHYRAALVSSLDELIGEWAPQGPQALLGTVSASAT